MRVAKSSPSKTAPASRIASVVRFRVVALLVLLADLGWAWYTRTPAEALYRGRPPAPMAGFPAPDLVLPTLDGGQARLGDLRGRPVILNFWASWCPPCRLEMPALQRVHEAYEGRIVVVGVHMTVADTVERARAFVQERGLTFPIWLDVQGRASETYNVVSLPTTFFIDARGTICEVVVGGPMAEALLRTRVAKLEAGCSP